MSQTSCVPKVKGAFIEKAEAIPVGCAVYYAHPGPDISVEAVYFVGGSDEREEAAALGHKRRNEDVDIELVVDVVRGGNSAQAAEERCWEILGLLEVMVRENPAMPSAAEPTGTVSGYVVWRKTKVTCFPHPQSQWLAEAVVTLNAVNRK